MAAFALLWLILSNVLIISDLIDPIFFKLLIIVYDKKAV